MANSWRPNFSGVGNITVPSIGDELLKFAALQQDRADKAKADARQAETDAWNKQVRDRQVDAWNQEDKDKQSILDITSNPQLYRYANPTITAAADKSVNTAFGDNGVMGKLMTQYNSIEDKDEANKFYMENIDPLNRKLQTSYENAPLFKEDVQKGVLSDLLAKGVDYTKANSIAAGMSAGYTSVADAQKAQDEEAKEKAKYNLDLYKALGDGGNANSKLPTSVKEAMWYANATPEMRKIYDKQNSSGSGNGSGKSAYDSAITKLGETTYFPFDLAKRDIRSLVDNIVKNEPNLDRDIVEKEVAGLIPQFIDDDKITDSTGFKEALTRELKNRVDNGSLSDTSSTTTGNINFGEDTVDSATRAALLQSILKQPGAVNVKGAASDKLLKDVNSIFGNTKTNNDEGGSGITEQTVSTTPESDRVYKYDKGGVPGLGRSLKSMLHVDGVPDSLLLSEDMGPTKMINGKKMYVSMPDINSNGKNTGKVVGMGYNYSAENKSPEEIRSDFEKAGIDKTTIEAAQKGEDISITEEQAKNLARVAYKVHGTDKAARVIGKDTYDKLDPMMKEVADNFAYRGDLKSSGTGYKADLTKLLREGDINSLFKYVNETPLPREVKQRLGKILTIERDNRLPGGNEDKPSKTTKNSSVKGYGKEVDLSSIFGTVGATPENKAALAYSIGTRYDQNPNSFRESPLGRLLFDEVTNKPIR